MTNVVKKLYTVLLFNIFLSSTLWAESFDRIVVIGDSLSDTGNTYQATAESFPPSPPFGGIPGLHPESHPGRFTDGKLWIEYLAESLGVSTPLPRGLNPIPAGTNYAFIGAVTGSVAPTYTSVLGITLTAGLPIKTQVQMYLGDLALGFQRPLDEHTLVSFNGGPNDLFLTNEPVYKIYLNIRASLQDLIDAGARHIVVFNIPALELLPAFASNNPSLAISDNINQNFIPKKVEVLNRLLKRLIFTMKIRNPRVKFYEVDVNSLMKEIFENPTLFGLDNVTVPVINEQSLYLQGQLVIQANPFTSFFYDGVHPTTQVHKILADYVISKTGLTQ